MTDHISASPIPERPPTQRGIDAIRTREQIIDIAMMIMSRQGYAGTKLEDVAAEMNMTRGAIYGHFSSKARLYEEILRCSQRPLYGLLNDAQCDPAPAPGVIYRFMLNWLRLLDRDPRHRASTEIFLNKSEMTDELVSVVQREIQLTRDMISGLGQVVRRGIAEGDIDPSVPPRRTAISIYAYLMGVMQTWLFNPRLFSLRNQAEGMVSAFVSGFLATGTTLEAGLGEDGKRGGTTDA